MKMIVAIVQPHRLDQVRDALSGVDVHGMTVSEVRGYGRQGGHTEVYRGAEYKIAYLPKVKLEVVVADTVADAAIEAIAGSARTGKIGDGKIFVLEVGASVRIRTGEEGDAAL